MKYMEKLLWWLITGKRGGTNRARIIKKLKDRPYNANQLSKELNLDYKTIRHHLRVLEENKVIKCSGDSYSKLYFLTSEMEDNYYIFKEIWEKVVES
ncbi:MAG: winged helix-turn-helix domain-containing protein [Methanobacterium sp.]